MEWFICWLLWYRMIYQPARMIWNDLSGGYYDTNHFSAGYYDRKWFFFHWLEWYRMIYMLARIIWNDLSAGYYDVQWFIAWLEWYGMIYPLAIMIQIIYLLARSFYSWIEWYGSNMLSIPSNVVTIWIILSKNWMIEFKYAFNLNQSSNDMNHSIQELNDMVQICYQSHSK
jgi:hypothetical protein